MKAEFLAIAHARIADCLMLDQLGTMVQRRDHLNLSGLGLSHDDLVTPFDPAERGLPRISLANLPRLRYLDLTGNELAVLPECVTQMTELVWLGLNFNKLTGIKGIEKLVELRRLYLRQNPIEDLPMLMGALQKLVELDLVGVWLQFLPTSMGHMKELEYVELTQAQLHPDQRAVYEGGKWPALREYLLRRDIEDFKAWREKETTSQLISHLSQTDSQLHRSVLEATSLFDLATRTRRTDRHEIVFKFEEAAAPSQFIGKVILVGSQEHGKTCLQRALRNEPFIEGHVSTDGMSRERLHLNLEGEVISADERRDEPGPQEHIIDLTLWDMGGQESYQHTHQMFFTRSAVYLIVTLPREGGGVQKLDEWIDLVKRRTEGEASIIVVSTWCNKHPADKALTLAELQAKHGDMIRAVMPVDSKDGTGIPELRITLAEVVQEPRARCRHTWLKGWAQVLNKLADSSEPLLHWPAIHELCVEHGIQKTKEQQDIIRTGHYIGSLLWREDIPAGQEVVILNPDWLSRAVARLLDDEDTQKAHGLVDIPKLERVWRGAGRDGTPGYEPEHYGALIELMEINELAYRPKVASKKVGAGDLLLVTQMVENLPRQDVEKVWNEISPKRATESMRVVAFRKVGDLGYGEVPDILYLLIFRLRDFSLGRKDYKQAMHWQRGLLVKDEYGSTGRIELEGEKLRITVRHHLEPGLMHSIIHRIGVGDDEQWNGRGLEKVEFVPCGQLCPANTPDAGLISMQDCAEEKGAGNSSIRCAICRKLLKIDALLQQCREKPDEVTSLLKSILSEVRKQAEETRKLAVLLRSHEDRIIEAMTSEWAKGPRLFSLLPVPDKKWNPKSWTHMTFRVTIWCESSRTPVPFFGAKKKDKPKEYLGTETITLSRDWVQKSRKILSLASWSLLAVSTGGAVGVGGIVTSAGGLISADDAKDYAAELARQQKVLKEVVSSIQDESKHLLRDKGELGKDADSEDYHELAVKAFGVPVEDDLALIRYLRGEFEKKDPTWGALERIKDDKYGRLWAHPNRHQA
jgi:hypothetical protein